MVRNFLACDHPRKQPYVELNPTVPRYSRKDHVVALPIRLERGVDPVSRFEENVLGEEQVLDVVRIATIPPRRDRG